MCKRKLLGYLLWAYLLVVGRPAMAIAAQSVKLDESSILSFGTDPSLDIIFGTWGPGMVFEGPVGNKAVVMGQNFYLSSGESGYTIGAHAHAVPPRDRAWSEWYYSLNHALLQSWTADVPGQAQLILRITPDGQVATVREVAFVPGVDPSGHFAMGDQTHIDFMKTVNQCLEAVSGLGGRSLKKIPSFPPDSMQTGPFKSATFVVTFSADKSLQASVPNLSVLLGATSDERSKWIARICTILDAGFLYKESDTLRNELPTEARHRIIPGNVRHTLTTTNYGPSGSIVWLPRAKGCADPKTSDALIVLLKSYLQAGRFVEAEGVARATVRDNALFKIRMRDLNRIKCAVEDAFRKGYFEMDRRNTPNPPAEATPNFI